MSEYLARRASVTRFVGPIQTRYRSENLSLRLEKLNSKLADGEDRKRLRVEVLGLLCPEPDAEVTSPYDLETLAVYRGALRRWREMLRARGVETVELTLAQPLLSGAGEKGVHEFGHHLQRLWGTPYIPGSSLKGIAARFARDFGGVQWHTGAPFLAEMFGTHQLSGVATFYDAWWIPGEGVAPNPFLLDIVNPHYMKYYEGKEWPHGMENPVPFHFPAIRKGERFLMAVSGPMEWGRQAMSILVQALATRGVGAKTALDYGRFRPTAGIGEAAFEKPPAVGLPQRPTLPGKSFGPAVATTNNAGSTPSANRTAIAPLAVQPAQSPKGPPARNWQGPAACVCLGKSKTEKWKFQIKEGTKLQWGILEASADPAKTPAGLAKGSIVLLKFHNGGNENFLFNWPD